MSTDAIQNVIGDFESLKSSKDSEWFSEQRRSALDSFKQAGFPSTRQENWKYTDVKQIARKGFSNTRTGQAKASKEELEQVRFKDLNCIELVFVNGAYSNDISHISALPEGVVVCDLATAFAKHKDLLEQHIKTDETTSSFTALNTAFSQHGVLIFVPSNTR